MSQKSSPDDFLAVKRPHEKLLPDATGITSPATNITSPANGDRLLTKGEFAIVIRRTTKTVDRWMEMGRLPHLRLGRTTLFPEKECMAYLRKKFGRNMEVVK